MVRAKKVRPNAYSNRTDLQGAQPVRAATNQPYGEAGAQRAMQRAMPVPQTTPVSAAPASTGAPPPMPGSLGPLDRPTERPNEPITAGVPLGAGQGLEALGSMPPPPGSPTLQLLQLLYENWPSNDLRILIEKAQESEGP